MMERPYYMPGVETHYIESKYVNQTYQIKVMQPLMRRGETERFPTLYLTDGNDAFAAAESIAHGLHVSGHVRRFVLVGIGYPGDNPFVGEILRGRDFTPKRRAEIPGLARASLIEGVPGIESGKKHWHGADDFLDFIRHELIPLVDSRYPVLPQERGYFGHSLGGALGLHALISQRALFNNFILSSPGVSWDGDPHGIEPVQDFIASNQPLKANVFMSVGGEEEFEPQYARSQFCSSFYRLAALLRRAKIRGLQFTCRLFPGETHASVWALAFTHGVQAVFGRAERQPMELREEPDYSDGVDS